MRFTEFWPNAPHWFENPELADLEERLASLSEKDRLLLMHEIACFGEASYRRGFQQAHAAGGKTSIWARRASQLEISNWRYNVPLEYAAPAPGYWENEERAERVWRGMRTGDYISLDRAAMEASGVSPFLDRLFQGVIGQITKAQVQEVWGDGNKGALKEEG